MAENLIIAGAWLVVALFFLLFNLKIGRASSWKIITFYGLIFSTGVAIFMLLQVTFRYY